SNSPSIASWLLLRRFAAGSSTYMSLRNRAHSSSWPRFRLLACILNSHRCHIESVVGRAAKVPGNASRADGAHHMSRLASIFPHLALQFVLEDLGRSVQHHVQSAALFAYLYQEQNKRRQYSEQLQGSPKGASDPQ